MAKNNNIKSEWKSTLIWTVIIMGIFTVLFLAIQKKSNTNVSKVNIVVKSSNGKKGMITKRDIKQKFRNYLGYDIGSNNIKELNLRELEMLLNEDDRVRRAEMYVDSRQVLNIYVAQKDPIVRIMNKNKESYYLDESGDVIPGGLGSAIRVPIATGSIESYSSKLLLPNAESRLKKIYDLAQYISKDEFLSALVEQIDIDEAGDIMIVPKIGNQKLSMGKAENMDQQFDRLRTLYKNGLPKIGWNKHSVFRLDLEGQITGTKRN